MRATQLQSCRRLNSLQPLASSCRIQRRMTQSFCQPQTLHNHRSSINVSIPAIANDGAQAQGPYSDLSDILSLSNIRQTLILMEDTIIFALIERAQYAQNNPVYESGAIPIPSYMHDGTRLSLLEYMLRETEQVHGRIRRYTSPDENAYFPESLPPLVLPPLSYQQVRIYSNSI